MRRGERGSSTVEMSLVGIGIIFVLISIFEISRGMWTYQTLAHAVREGVRYAAVHGQNCYLNAGGVVNTCGKTMQEIARVVQDNGLGLDLTTTQLSFAIGSAGPSSCALNACPTSNWPGATTGPGTRITISAIMPFNSALAMFWPGSRPVSFMRGSLGATASEPVKF